jgi:transposase-like protein
VSKRPKKYPPEFRARAVRLAEESEKPIAEVARDLGIGRQNALRLGQPCQEDGRCSGQGAGLAAERRGGSAPAMAPWMDRRRWFRGDHRDR